MAYNTRKRAAAADAAGDAPAPREDAADDDHKASAPRVGSPAADAADDAAYREPWIEYERFAPWIVLTLAFATRFYRLTEPKGVVFDEYHVSACSRERETASRPTTLGGRAGVPALAAARRAGSGPARLAPPVAARLSLSL